MKTVLITGASGGIGKEIATKFAENGYNVVLNYHKHEKKAKDISLALNKIGVRTLLIKADVSNDKEVEKMIKTVLSNFGKIDVLVNNAGVALSKILQETTNSEIQKTFGVNCFGTINCTKAVVNSMISNKSGNIINISSIWGKVGASMETIYSASKGAVIAFTKAVAKELAPSNIRVNCICPGVIETEMLNCYTDDEKNELKISTPLSRLGSPKDVANAVFFLSQDSSSFITGQIVTIDGGFIL